MSSMKYKSVLIKIFEFRGFYVDN